MKMAMALIEFCNSSSTNCVFDILGEVGVELEVSLGLHNLTSFTKWKPGDSAMNPLKIHYLQLQDGHEETTAFCSNLLMKTNPYSKQEATSTFFATGQNYLLFSKGSSG